MDGVRSLNGSPVSPLQDQAPLDDAIKVTGASKAPLAELAVPRYLRTADEWAESEKLFKANLPGFHAAIEVGNPMVTQ